MHSSFPVDAGLLLGAALVIVGVAVGGVADRYRLLAVAPDTAPETLAEWAATHHT
jgi:hypothetical protein